MKKNVRCLSQRLIFILATLLLFIPAVAGADILSVEAMDSSPTHVTVDVGVYTADAGGMLENDMRAAVAWAAADSAGLDGFETAGGPFLAADGGLGAKCIPEVPIPSALLLLGSGLIGFIGLRRKRLLSRK